MGISDFFNKRGKDTTIGKLIKYDQKHYGNPNSTFGQRLSAASIRTAEKLVSINPSSIRYGYYTGKYNRAGAIKEAGSRITSGLFGSTAGNIIAPSKEKFDRLHNRGRRRFNGFGNYGDDIEKLKDATFDILDTQKLMSDVLDETYNVLSKTNEVLQDLALTSKKNEQLLQQIIYLRSPGVSKSANISPINSRNPYETKSSEGGIGIKEGVAATTIGALIARFLISPPGLAIIGSALAIGGWTKIFSEVSKYRNRRRSAIDRGENDPAINERNKLADDVAKSGGWGSSASQNYLKGKSSTDKSNRLPNPTEPIKKNTSITKIDEYIINTSQNITFTSDKFIMFEAKGSDGIRFKSDKIIFDSNNIEFTSNTKISENTPDKTSDKSSTTTPTNKTAETGIGHTQPKRLPTDSDSLVGSSVGGWNRNETNARRGSGGRARESGSSGPSSSSSGVSTKYGEKGGPDYSDPFDIGNKSGNKGDVSLKNINSNQLAFIRGIGATESNFNKKDAYSDYLNKSHNNANVRKYGSKNADYGYYQNNKLDVADAIKLGVPPEIAKHLHGGGANGNSTIAQQTRAMHEYLSKKYPSEYNALISGDPSAFEAARQKMKGKWFGLRDNPNVARQEFKKGNKSADEIFPENKNIESVFANKSQFNESGLFNPITANSLSGRPGSDSASMGPGAHQGVDMMAARGSPVYASKDGKVVKIGTDNFGQPTLTIRHNDGTYSRYLHMKDNHYKVGDEVKGGQQVGTSGTANGVDHLHFERWSQEPNKYGHGLIDPRKEYGWDNKSANGQKIPIIGGQQFNNNKPTNVPGMESLPDVEVAKNIVNTPYNAKNNSIVSYSRDFDKQEQAARILEKQRQESYRKSWDNTSPEWNNNPIIPDLVGDRPERQFSAKDQMETQPVVRPSGVEVSGSTQSWNTNDFYTTPSAPEVNSKSDAPPIIKSDTNKDTKAVPDATPF